MDDRIYQRGSHVGVLYAAVDEKGNLAPAVAGVFMEWGQLLSSFGS